MNRDALRPRAARQVVAGVLALAGAACASDESGPADTGPVPTWPAKLELRIGALDDPVYSLTAIRGMEIGPGGSIYTLHATEALIRQFDSEGMLVRTIGGRGGGPGEFQRASAMGRVADTLWVMDTNGYRLSRFGLDGEFLGSFSVPFDMGSGDLANIPPRAQGLLFDGTVYGDSPAASSGLADGSISAARPVLMTRSGEVTGALPSVPYTNLVWDISVPGSRGGSYRPQPYSDTPRYVFSVSERALIIADRPAPSSLEDATYRVIGLGFEGDTLFDRAFEFEPVPIDEAVLDSLIGVFVEFTSNSEMFSISRGEARRLAESTLYRPAYRPGVRYLVPGRDGSIAIGLEPGDADAARWLFLDADGEPMGGVVLPSNVFVRQVDLPLLWGVETDAFDVPYVVRYRVETSMIGTRADRTGQRSR